MNKKISILGCGWLGLPLAIYLITNGWLVKGSTTSTDKLNLLLLNEIDPYLVQLQQILSTKESNFWDSEVLLVNVPPGLRKRSGKEYLDEMRNLVEVVEASPIKKVIFISSTSVYPELNKIIVDTDEVDENSALYQSEMLFAQSTQFITTVIRFGGLIGPGREPARFFAGKKDIPNGQAPVNLIQLEDCIGIIQMVLDKQMWGEIYNAVSPVHPTKAEFYKNAAKKAGLVEPQFVNELNDWKVIDSRNLPYEWRSPLKGEQEP
ncbi:MAG: SDR family NAD(P)-dependent oxidoreductase [Mucilaginibacter sp.]|uniref:SDR family NAD(P)-dependent oxidoreductase n=1 Tax=Mucilaginibacter sp. TaxID=1882438 RepID=UPI003263EAAA